MQKGDAGIKVKVFSSKEEKSWHIEGVKAIRESGIELVDREKMHEKIIVIDEKILYHGSLNALSQNDSTESMLRILDPRVAREVSEYIQSEKLYAGKQSKGSDLDQAVLEKLEKITLSVKKLPPYKEVCKCGNALVPKFSKETGAFYSCDQRSSSTKKDHTAKDPSPASLEEIRELQDQLCTVCGNSMSLDLQNKPQRVLLVCNNGSCGRMKRVIFTW